eukprot:Lankesteria_metandrocarpae@DN4783_c0_g1_i1.p1
MYKRDMPRVSQPAKRVGVAHKRNETQNRDKEAVEIPGQKVTDYAATTGWNPVVNQGSVLGGKWIIGNRIGAGAFGEVYAASSTDNRMQVAAKTEVARPGSPSMLLHEAKVLKNLRGGEGIAHFHGVEKSPSHNVLIMQQLGPSLESLFQRSGMSFSTICILTIAQQILKRLEYIHDKSYIHRDVKPDNFLIGNNDPGRVYVVDFGLAKRYRAVNADGPPPTRRSRSMVGTARYASLNSHSGIDLSARDDLESLGYVIMYFATGGNLPWQGLNVRSREDKHRKIYEAKMKTDIQTLCEGHPPEFATYIQYCRRLEFDAKPDYEYLHRLFRSVRARILASCTSDDLLPPKLDWLGEQGYNRLSARKRTFRKVGAGRKRNRRAKVHAAKKKSSKLQELTSMKMPKSIFTSVQPQFPPDETIFPSDCIQSPHSPMDAVSAQYSVDGNIDNNEQLSSESHQKSCMGCFREFRQKNYLRWRNCQCLPHFLRAWGKSSRQSTGPSNNNTLEGVHGEVKDSGLY